MNTTPLRLAALTFATIALNTSASWLTVPALAAEIPLAITTPDKVETRLGTLDFKDGVPSSDTADKVYDDLDFSHAFQAFVNTMQGVNVAARGRRSATPDHDRGSRTIDSGY
jgi:hypothetical protein